MHAYCTTKMLDDCTKPSNRVQLLFREECYAKMREYNSYGVYKPPLIDLEAYSESQGDRGQAEADSASCSLRD